VPAPHDFVGYGAFCFAVSAGQRLSETVCLPRLLARFRPLSKRGMEVRPDLWNRLGAGKLLGS